MFRDKLLWRFFMFKNNYVLLLIVFLSTASMFANESWLQTCKNIFFSNSQFTRHQLYKKCTNESLFDDSVAENIQSNQEYYLDMIEESILKREQNGSKAGKILDVTKILFGAGQLSMPIIGYYILQHYQLDYPVSYTIPAALLFCGFGLNKIYKGIFYKSRMEYKLERDKLTRRTIREITHQI